MLKYVYIENKKFWKIVSKLMYSVAVFSFLYADRNAERKCNIYGTYQ